MRKAIVMAGGQGSRLWPLTLMRPKPLIPVVNRPVMAHILNWLRSHGFTEVLATLHYRADDLRRAFGDGRSFGLQLTYRVEEEPMGTAGSVKLAEDWIQGEPFLLISGDALTDLDLTALQQKHRASGAWLTLALHRVPDPSHYGVVEIDARGRVIRFQEKPERERAFSNLANTGIYCVEPQVLEWVPRGQSYDWSHDVFPQIMAEGLPLYGQVVDGYWCDIGTMDEYRRSQRDALEGTVQVNLPGIALRPGVWVGTNAWIAPGAVIRGPVLLGAGCRIEPGARVLPGSVIGEGAIIRAGASVRNAVVGAECEIGSHAVVRDSVLDEGVTVGTASSLTEGVVVGRGCHLAAWTHLANGRRIEPEQVLFDPRSRPEFSPSRVRLQCAAV